MRFPGVKSAVAFRWGDARINGNDETVNGANIAGLADVLNLKFVAGDASGAARGGILLSEREAKGYRKQVGDRITIQFPQLAAEFEVAGIYKTRRFSGAFPIDFIVAKDRFEQWFGGSQQDTLLYVKAEDGQAASVGAGAEAGPRRTVPQHRRPGPARLPAGPGADRRSVPQRVHRAVAAVRGHRRARHREHVDAVGVRTDA